MSGFQPGDILEIRTDDGFAYVQVTHNHVAYPEVIRALAGRHAKRPANPADLASGRTAFTAMIPIGSILERGVLTGEKVANAAVPEEARDFPTFKIPIRDKTGAIAYWWYWNGEGLRYDADPNDAPAEMPPREVTTANMFFSKLSEV